LRLLKGRLRGKSVVEENSDGAERGYSVAESWDLLAVRE